MRDAIRHGAVRAARLEIGGEHTRALDASGRAVRGRRSRVVPTPGVLASSLAVMWRPNRARTSISRDGDGGNSATLPEESTKDTVKTIRAGKAGRSASPVIPPRVHFCSARICGCHRRPAFPASSGFQGRRTTARPGRNPPRDRGGVSAMERVDCESNLVLHTPSLRAQRSNPDCLRGTILDCFAALAMTLG